MCTVAVHCLYIKDAFSGFCQEIYLKKRLSQKVHPLPKDIKVSCNTSLHLERKPVWLPDYFFFL